MDQRWHGTFGIVTIDEEFTWFLPEDLEDKTVDELREAIRLTYNPPHPVDGGFGARALADVRDRLAEDLRRRGGLPI